MLIDTSIGASPRPATRAAIATARRRWRVGGPLLPALACAVVVGVTACHEPVRTDASYVHLSAHEREVACRLYRELREAQGAAFEQRAHDQLGGRLDDC